MNEAQIGTLDLYPTEFFRREDEYADPYFYTQPRLVVHVDDQALVAINRYFELSLPAGGALLDLMSSWRSHLPESIAFGRVVGLGLNTVEMKENPQLHEHVLHDLNANPTLPFGDETFEAVLLTVSIQYMTRPIEVFREVCRILKPGGSFHVVFSGRMFPAKAVAIWKALEMPDRVNLIASYFEHAGGWDGAEALNVSPNMGFPTDLVYVMRAAKSPAYEILS